MGDRYRYEKVPQPSSSLPRDTPVVVMFIVTLEKCFSSWTSDNQKGILTCEEKIKFDGFSESLTVFRIEITGILIKYGLLQLFYLASVGGSGVTPPHLYFQSAWLGVEFNMAVNN